jgi:hypothetical protein
MRFRFGEGDDPIAALALEMGARGVRIHEHSQAAFAAVPEPQMQ